MVAGLRVNTLTAMCSIRRYIKHRVGQHGPQRTRQDGNTSAPAHGPPWPAVLLPPPQRRRTRCSLPSRPQTRTPARILAVRRLELVLELPPRLSRVKAGLTRRGRASAMASLGRLKSAIFDREERKM